MWALWVSHKLWAMRKEVMDGLFPTIFHGKHSELREKYGIGFNLTVVPHQQSYPWLSAELSVPSAR